ncbi:DUF4339 domain-containing protein [Mesorhizobium abyssinicae]|uniref:DUF4339 domain-containing protein n=1 Tax=Mesorhizobium abyssinicae TaxID=1209958 RepID=A0ABU5AS47_9HYPH|nr:DUF4339 domain-containing protein [Mesorhizobium abyssinicae]MDX8540108.1 DUF4339 domain-containing protein [Mesorhizobium abyssinicae]
MTEWYYEQNGAHRGPVSEADLNVMLANRLIDASTRVWTASFGQQWKHAHETELEVPRPTPPPLSPVVGPPQLPTPAVKGPKASKAYAYLLAFLPLLDLLLITAVASAGGPDVVSMIINIVPVGTAIASLLLAYLDAKELRRANIISPTKVMVPFVLLLPGAYLIRRSVVTRLSWTPFWIWLVSFLVLAGIIGTLAEP